MPPDVVCALCALFIVAMAWLRTRMLYPRAAGERRLTAAGAVYFASLGLSLLGGWVAAPPLMRSLATAAPVPPTLARVVWFLVVYYLSLWCIARCGHAGWPYSDPPNGRWCSLRRGTNNRRPGGHERGRRCPSN